MKRLTININGRFLTQPITGVQRYAVESVKALDNLLNRGEIDCGKFAYRILVPSKGLLHKLDLQRIAVNRVGYLRGHFWEQVELPFHASNGLLLNLCNAAPMAIRNQVVTIHDAAVFEFPDAYSFAFRTWYRFMLKRLGKVAAKIVTVSEFSKRELIRYCRMDESKISVVHEGAEHILTVGPQDHILEKFGLSDRRYILAVSSLNPNKNFNSVVKAIDLLKNVDYDFVIAGGVNPSVFSGTQVCSSKSVKFAGYVSDAELRTLYDHADCFVYPSFYEGFGLPPLEAMACGCPVIVSNQASLPEVCGDAAIFCDPYNPEDIAEKIRLVITDEALRERLREKGLEHAKRFTWERCAKKTLSVIEEVLGK